MQTRVMTALAALAVLAWYWLSYRPDAMRRQAYDCERLAGAIGVRECLVARHGWTLVSADSAQNKAMLREARRIVDTARP